MTKFMRLLGLSLALGLAHQSAMAWTITQAFDDKSDGASCGWDAAGGSTVSSAMAHSGSKSCRLSVEAGAEAFGMWGGIINHPAVVRRGGELWLRVRTYMPSTFNYNANPRLKFMRIHTMSDSNSNYGYDDIYINTKGTNPPFQFIYEGEQEWSFIGSLTASLTSLLTGQSTTQAIKLGAWETYEMYVKFDPVPVSKGGAARVRFWKDGVLMSDITDRITLKTADSYSERTHLFTYWNGTAPATQHMFVDDVVLTSETPAGRDAKGNPYVGTGVSVTRPASPSNVSTQ